MTNSTKTNRFLLAAGISLAMAITISCDPKDISGSIEEKKTPSSSSVGGSHSIKCDSEELIASVSESHCDDCGKIVDIFINGKYILSEMTIAGKKEVKRDQMNNWDELAEIVKGWQNINAVMYNTCKVSAINDCTADWVSMGIEFDVLFDFLKSNRYCPADSQLVPLCEDNEYNPETHFCYVNYCGRLKSCDGQVNCPDVCAVRGEVWEKCGGKEYNPRTHECVFMGCQAVGCTYGNWEIVAKTNTPKCDGKPYNPETHFCFVNECGQSKACDPCGSCPAVCVYREDIWEKCDGKGYDPRTHYCYIDECGQSPSCPMCDVCYRREEIREGRVGGLMPECGSIAK